MYNNNNYEKDENLVKDRIAKTKNEIGIVGASFKFKPDSFGEPSFWIQLRVADESRNNIAYLIALKRSITNDLYESGIDSSPYVQFCA